MLPSNKVGDIKDDLRICVECVLSLFQLSDFSCPLCDYWISVKFTFSAWLSCAFQINAAVNFDVMFKHCGQHKTLICLYLPREISSLHPECTKWTLENSELCDLFTYSNRTSSFMVQNEIVPEGFVESNKLNKL